MLMASDDFVLFCKDRSLGAKQLLRLLREVAKQHFGDALHSFIAKA